MSTPDLNRWYARIAWQTIDVDGAFPGECHDVALSWMYYLGVTPGDGHAPGSGYTDQVWRQFPHHRPGLANHFTKHDASEIRRGDIVYWSAYAGVGGLPHTAVATGPASGGYVRAVTQNPDAVHIENLTLDGVLGVLRPIALQEDIVTPEDIEAIAQRTARLILLKKVKTSGGGTTSLRRYLYLSDVRFNWLRKSVTRVIVYAKQLVKR